jgi:pimeloyl-ACP methyl ester carboxylesterase
MNLFLTRRRLLAAGLAGAGLGAALLAGCSVRARTTNSDGTPFDDARQSPAADSIQRRDGFAFVESDWTDATRGRPVPVRLYLPTAAAAGAQLPLVVFSHGLGGSRRGYSYLGSHFARHGIASFHVQHVGSDRAIWGGSPFELTARLQSAAQDQEAVDRVADLRFALDRLLALEAGHPMRIAVDPARVVVAGHSYGANTALLASGARVERNGRAIDLRDPRLRAAILLSAPPFYGESEPDRVLRPVTLPSLHVTATGDDIKIPGYYSSVTDRIELFEATGSEQKALAVFQGGSHSIFTDRQGTGGVELNPRVKRATQDLAVAFLESALDGRHEALLGWPERHREIVARFDRLPALG